MSIRKILGKYTIIDELAPNRFEVEYNSNSYIIEKYKKNNDSEIYSNTARNLSSVTHSNISSLMLEEDDKNFYFVNHNYSEEDGQYQILSSNRFKDRYGELSYSRLVKCYTQICSAIKYIHEKGFYHGNINPNNIIIDRNENVYLLDFGRSYLYNDISNNKEKTFLAPEQIKEKETCNESDIFSFGLCVLKLIADNYDGFNFEKEYNTFEDLPGIFEKLKGFLDDKETLRPRKREVDATILLWCKSMLEIEPEKRTDLIEIDRNFNKLLEKLISESSYYSDNIFLIRLNQNILESYSDYGCYNAYDVAGTIQENIYGKASYWYFEEDSRKGKSIIRILSGDYIFYCFADNENENEYPFSKNRKVDCLFCFKIHETKSNRGDDEKSHLERYGNKCNCELKLFDKTTARQISREEYDNVWDFVDRIKSQYENKLKIEKLNEINKEAIDSEEELLRAEKKVLDSKKTTAKVICKSIDKGRDEVSFELENCEEEIAVKSNFQIGQNVIISEFNNCDNEIKGVISNCYNLKIDVKLEKYKTNEFNESNYVNKEFLISYDYLIEEIILGKQNRALKELQKGNSYIPNFYRKICNPNDFIKNELIDIDTYSNIKLDDDQKEAVRKGLSIDEGCEILAIQGPPGTGKTTVITEIIEQYLRQKNQDRILVASQSNQAVDNVLKHIIEDKVEVDKITRVGEVKRMTDEAKQYSPEKVLNTIIKNNLDRIKNNPIRYKSNIKIETELKELQDSFYTTLQTLTQELFDKSSQKKNSNTGTSEIGTIFLSKIRVFFGTLIGISSWDKFKEMVFDMVIVDEAGRATLSELLVPCIKARKLILVGDHKQLAPVIPDEVMNVVDDSTNVETSFFEKYFEKLKETDRPNLKHTLKYNYRAERKICDLYSNAFYDGILETTDEVNKLKKHNLKIFQSSVVWIKTDNCPNKEDKQEGTGKINQLNSKIICNLIKKMSSEIGDKKVDIGIITPYRAQVNLLKKVLDKSVKCDIGTVDSFQGSDREIIIYDCVRSTGRKMQDVSFIADEKRLNVSLSRAKKLLIIVGDMGFLDKSKVRDGFNPFPEIIKNIIQDYENYQIVNAEDYL